MKSIPISLSQINDKIKEILAEKSDYDTNEFETTTSNSSSIEEIYEHKTQTESTYKRIRFDPNSIDKTVKERSILSVLPDFYTFLSYPFIEYDIDFDSNYLFDIMLWLHEDKLYYLDFDLHCISTYSIQIVS